MAKKEVVLTEELYQEISGDKRKKIIDYREQRKAMKASAEEEKQILSELKAERAKLDEVIQETKKNRNKSIIRFIVLKIKLIQQIILSSKLDKAFSNEALTIKIDKYYPETKNSKRR